MYRNSEFKIYSPCEKIVFWLVSKFQCIVADTALNVSMRLQVPPGALCATSMVRVYSDPPRACSLYVPYPLETAHSHARVPRYKPHIDVMDHGRGRKCWPISFML